MMQWPTPSPKVASANGSSKTKMYESCETFVFSISLTNLGLPSSMLSKTKELCSVLVSILIIFYLRENYRELDLQICPDQSYIGNHCVLLRANISKRKPEVHRKTISESTFNSSIRTNECPKLSQKRTQQKEILIFQLFTLKIIKGHA